MIKKYWTGVALAALVILGFTVLPPMISSDDWLVFGLGVALLICWPVAGNWLFQRLRKKGV